MVVTRPQYLKKLEMHRAGRISIEEEEVISANEIALMVKDFEDTTSSYRTNIALAAHVTANGRMRLWPELHAVGEWGCGCDTDSCWYIQAPGGYQIKTGPFVGDWEPESSSGYIIGMAGTGKKSYSHLCLPKVGGTALVDLIVQWRDRLPVSATELILEYLDQDSEISYTKCKGVSLGYVNSKRIQYFSMRELVLKRGRKISVQGPPIARQSTSMISTKLTNTRDSRKIVQFTANKRRRISCDHLGEFQNKNFTLPPGHKWAA